jgi:hypothetical protein
MKPRASSNTMAAILNGVFLVIICILWYSNIVLLDHGELQRVTTKQNRQHQLSPALHSRKISSSSPPENDELAADKPLVEPIDQQTASTNNRTANFHIVFSTGCNAFQDCESCAVGVTDATREERHDQLTNPT